MLVVGLIPNRADVSPLVFAIGFGVRAWGAFREELFPLSTATYKSLVEKDRPWEREIPVVTQSGRHPRLRRRHNQTEANGTIIQYVGVKQDITDRKELERLREEVDRITRHDVRQCARGQRVAVEFRRRTETRRLAPRAATDMVADLVGDASRDLFHSLRVRVLTVAGLPPSVTQSRARCRRTERRW